MRRAPHPLALLVLVACDAGAPRHAPTDLTPRRSSAAPTVHLAEQVTTLSSPSRLDMFGAAVSLGADLDDDGYDDLVAGATYSTDCGTRAGSAYVLPGGPDGIDEDATTGLCPSSGNASYYGEHVLAGPDLDDDGLPDVVLSARGTYKSGTNTMIGAVYVCLGAAGGPASMSCDPLQSASATSSSSFGMGLGGDGDIDGDGVDDLAVGAFSQKVSGLVNAGTAYVYYGGAGGPSTADEQIITPPNLARNAYFGYKIVGPADLDGDGYGDLLVVNGAGSGSSGYAELFLGTSGGVDTTSIAAQLWPSDPATWSGFGHASVEPTDLDDDGHLDLVLSGRFDDDTATDAGAVYVYYGSTTGPDSATEDKILASDGADSDQFGWSLDLLTLSDGERALLVGAIEADGAEAGAGAVYVYPIDAGAVDSAGEAKLWASDGLASDWYGYALAADGDLDGDGIEDVVVGAPSRDGSNTSEGAIYVYVQTEDPDGDGWDELDDCDEGDTSINPGATDTCDGLDNDCDPDTAETCWGRDADGDGYGDPDDVVDASVAGPGYVDDTSDCDDADADIHPAAEEVPGDEVDQDCDGVELCWLDRDEDGYSTGTTIDSLDEDCDDAVEAGAGEPDGDCDDGDPTVNPGVTDVTGDSVDSDCDGLEACYVDADADGYRDDLSTVVDSGDLDCTGTYEADAETPAGDCDDADATVHPGAEELPGDELDQDCDGAELCRLDDDDDGYRGHADNTVTSVDTDCADAGEATEAEPTGDCDDDDATIWPGATEIAGDGVDQDCDGGDLCAADLDEDGHADASGATVSSSDLVCDGPGEAETADPADDCDDADSGVYPGVTEIVGDGIDQDCDGIDDIDADGDGAWSLADCDDADASVYPGADDPPGDGVDQDCDGLESCYQDADGDGYRPDDTSTVASPDADCSSFGEALATTPIGDCDDASFDVNPGVTDVTGDDTDSDCDGLERCYQDADDDGYRPDETSEVAADDADCADPGEALGTEPTGDCDDTEPTVHPGGVEVADGLDNDCSGADETVDLDGDGLDELEEQAAGTDAAQADTDGDAISDGDELTAGTDPLDTNSDDDGLSDGEELALGTDPLDPDSDDDGLIDGEEVEVHGTDPLDADSDDDGLGDGVEVDETGTLPDDADTDDDGLGDGDEMGTWGTDPFEPDSDGDGLTDGDEVSWTSTDPQDEDSDDDGLSDGDEVITWSTDPNDADSDGDGLTDLDEIEVHGTNPNRADTDQGGVDDGAELEAGTDPLDASDDTDSKVTETGCAAAPHGGGPALLAAGLLLLGRRRREGWAARLDRRGTRE